MATDAERIDRAQEPDASGEDVEILEVVGVREDDSPDTPAEPASAEDDGEVVIDLDQEAAGEPDAGGTPPSADDETAERLKRLQADYENLRKRVDRERREFESQASSNLVSRLLPVLDNFERALNVEPRNDGDSTLHRGVALIYRHLMQELRREGLKVIEAVGQPFDPSLHDAVATEAPLRRDGVVIEEMQRGYLFRNRLLRPTLVKVGEDESPETGSGAAEG